MSRFALALVLSVASLAAIPAAAGASGVAYPDADWSEAWIPSSDGVTLHADVLRPKGATDAAKTPAIISIGPYFNHSGQTGPAGPAEGTSYDPVGPNAGPSERFQDFVEGSGLLKKGYSFVMVDLRGFGGSNGCLDWSGPGEQADVVNAVKWAASRSWSTGKVGMYGKSYDGADRPDRGRQAPCRPRCGRLAGTRLRRLPLPVRRRHAPRELRARRPRSMTGSRRRRGRSPTIRTTTSTRSTTRSAWGRTSPPRPANDDHGSDFWKQRNLIPGAAGSKVPLFLTQGLTENNTVADGLQQYLDNHTGYERAWLGPWEHVRGNETDDTGRLKMGRAGWFDEVMRFYDLFLKGDQADGQGPDDRGADERRQVAR